MQITNWNSRTDRRFLRSFMIKHFSCWGLVIIGLTMVHLCMTVGGNHRLYEPCNNFPISHVITKETEIKITQMRNVMLISEIVTWHRRLYWASQYDQNESPLSLGLTIYEHERPFPLVEELWCWWNFIQKDLCWNSN